MTDNYDTLIVGGGHNGLVCAAYLAKSGHRVCVLERRDFVGGAAVTEEFHPGYRVSSGAQFLQQLHPDVVKDLALEEHGLKFAAKNLATTALALDAEHLTIIGDQLSGAAVSAADQAAFKSLMADAKAFAGVMRLLIDQPPIDIFNADNSDKWTAVKAAWSMRFGLGKDRLRELLRIGAMNMFDHLNDKLEHDLLKGALALDSVLGSHFGIRSSGNVVAFLYRLTMVSKDLQGLPEGGMGSLTAALARSAEAAGVEIRTAAPVTSINVENCRVTGVTIAGGEMFTANRVISNADVKKTVLELVGSRHFEADFVHAVSHVRMRGSAAKLHLALSGLPDFSALNGQALAARMVIAPSVDEIENAFNPIKYGGFSRRPLMEFSLPSISDRSLVDGDGHVLNATVQYAPYSLKGGWTEAARAQFLNVCLDQLARYAPDIKAKIQHAELLTPVDLEQRFGMTGGDWNHGEMALDQLYVLRPVPAAARYGLPLDGLYLCGAGTHPGGGVMGAAGRNSAGIILKEAV